MNKTLQHPMARWNSGWVDFYKQHMCPDLLTVSYLGQQAGHQ